FAIIGAFNPAHTATLLKRLAGMDAEYPTQTVVSSTTGNLTIRIGDDATISATASTDHEIPAAGRLFVKEKGSEDKWKELPMKKSADSGNEFSRQLKDLTRDTLFYVRLGDDRGEEHEIEVITAPLITDVDLVLKYPEYMDRENGESDQLNLEVREGTTVKWTISCDTPVSSWEVLVPTDWGAAGAKETEAETGAKSEAEEKDAPKFRSIPAELDESGTTATFELPIEKALKYSFRWVEKENSFSYEDVQYGVKVTSDGLPDVDLLQPREVGYATVGKVVKMEAKGTDDIGLDKAWLVYALNGADETKVEIFNFDGDTNKTFDYSWKLSDNLKELKPNDRISFAIEVADRHPDRKIHLRRTAPRQLTIVTPETYL
ncbi:MAG: hypothetical protein VYC95_09265, partial [Verrucomicrobiota bacterium]|nr:hypothetical protein [Verrucomicrobiota bacterium]